MEEMVRKCAFCGRDESEVKRMFESDSTGLCICEKCIESCYDMLEADREEYDDDSEVDLGLTLLKPHEIKAKLDEHIVGQDDAKKVLSVAVYNHYKRINSKQTKDGIELEKSNILMLGPTGCGKTLLAKTLARILKGPFAIADATTITEAGYVGDDVENILLKLIQAADGDVKKAELGIVYVDEIDKISKKSENTSITRDVGGEGVQQSLLKIIESTIASVPPQGGRKHPQQECIQINTTNILFICGGAFVGLDQIIDKRLNGHSMGFGGNIKTKDNTSYSNLIKNINPEDLINFGLIPEFVGRLPIVVGIDALDEKALIKILTEPKNATVKQYKKLFKLDGVDVEFEPEALSEVAKQAIKLNTGARGLRSILENIMLELMYDVPSDNTIEKIVITKEVIQKTQKPTIIRKSA